MTDDPIKTPPYRLLTQKSKLISKNCLIIKLGNDRHVNAVQHKGNTFISRINNGSNCNFADIRVRVPNDQTNTYLSKGHHKIIHKL
jgi:hypothetical protein